MSKIKNLSGQKFGFLIVVSLSHKDKNYLWYWNCLCDCGNYCIVRCDRLKSHLNINCGCRSSFYTSNNRIAPNYQSNISRILRQYKKRGIKSGKGYSLSREDFEKLIFDNCYYCNSRPNNCCVIKTKFQNIKLFYNGIDRVDSSKGYSINNCVSCCIVCNIAKNSMTINEFFTWIDAVYKFSIKNCI